jgi:hypothetical protein
MTAVWLMALGLYLLAGRVHLESNGRKTLAYAARRVVILSLLGSTIVRRWEMA